MTAREQNKLAGIFLIAHGALQAVVMGVFGLIYGGLGVAMISTSNREEEQFAGMAFIVLMLVIGAISLIFILPQVIGGWKMIKEGKNARTWGIIGSIVSCFSFPFGTAAGVFGLIFLFGEAGQRFYLGGGQERAFVPPPPNSWQ